MIVPDPDKTAYELTERPLSDGGESSIPSHIGRYRVEKVLGQGGFGVVYLSHDDQLQRRVAIKVPHARLVAHPTEAEAYLGEAQIVAKLDHPQIVPVFDVGSTAQFPVFVVSKYIDGIDLAHRLKRSRMTLSETVELVVIVAEALHYAHKQGLVHRDIKPANLLLDKDGKPFVADFGLALREQDVGKGPRFAGTPAYMSPEQARGEGHRVDGRSDIFSLGVVFYELLLGRRPLKDASPHELLEQITSVEVRPPRQYDESIPKELDRICLKALSKRAAERYSTATDMADDLRHFLVQQPQSQTLAIVSTQITPVVQPISNVAGINPPAMPNTPTTPASYSQVVKIVPKGLRSFDAHDANFFLELLPGPRDREGLPDSLRFWKTRIEELDADNTFAVGLVYGPSGCGKSSLIKAGLLPRLSSNVIVVYVEATAGETETRLLSGLRKRCPALPDNLLLKDTLAALRRGQYIPVGKKVVFVLDQFEQWLHARKEEKNTELVSALRQCDGGRVQCIVMVRDDFWLAVSRFLRELEIRLLEGQNSALADLFDADHAKKVLAAFDRAFGKLPENAGGKSQEQNEFLQQAVNGLAQEGKVISVRLALFAEMMKGKPWTPATLKDVGGTQGVGVTFLEETFSATTAPPEHRYHQKAARRVLNALLPDAGTNIKGHMRSHDNLLEASGYASRPTDFDDLLNILDGEIRLITPTDPEGKEDADASAVLAGAKYYQLTHDYLVPALRDWLTRKQKETRRGRAELLLADQAAVWNARPENRQLPSLWQWFQIRWLTQKENWTLPQRKMMRKAGRYQLFRGLMATVMLCLIAVGSWEGYGRLKAQTIRDRLLESTTEDVPGIIKEMAPYHRWVDPLLQAARAQAEERRDFRRQLHASLGLLPVDVSQVDYLLQRLLMGEPHEVVVIREALLSHQSGVTERLWVVLENAKADQDQRFRAACALSKFSPDDPRWESVSDDVAAMLVTQKPFVIGQWTATLQGAGHWLIPPLAEFLVDDKRGASERGLIASVYGRFADVLPEAYTRLEQQLATTMAPEASENAKIELTNKQASIGLALMVNGRGEQAWPLLKHSPDPTLRSYLIEQLGPGGIVPKILIDRFESENDVSVKRAILLSLGEYGLDRLTLAERRNHVPRLLQLYRDDPDAGIHGAAEWLLRRWQALDELNAINKELTSGNAKGSGSWVTGKNLATPGWYINRRGEAMVVIPPPGEFWVGERSERVQARIDRSFAISAKERTVDQFLQFRAEFSYDKTYAPTGDCSIIGVTWYDAVEYCNWLSEQEGQPPEQWCYLPNSEGKYAEGMTLAPDYVKRTGYRLATEVEWEYACRAGADSGYAFGEPVDLLAKHAWHNANALSKSHPPGLLQPNDFGLFDMHGNQLEWCADSPEAKLTGGMDPINTSTSSSRSLRGGSWRFGAVGCHSWFRHGFPTAAKDWYLGIRVVGVPSNK